jgi:chromate transporter
MDSTNEQRDAYLRRQIDPETLEARGRPATEMDHDVSFGQAARFWVKLGFINFGGPTGQIAIMHDELVDRRRWVSNRRFLHALNYCMLLPGPEAQQLAIYVGWLLHKVKGGLVAGIAFILPAFFLILALSWTYAVHGDVPAIAGVFSGLQAAVVGIVASALIRIGGKALRNGATVGIAAAAFVAIFLVHVPFPFIIIAAGLIGLLGAATRPEHFALPEAHGDIAGAIKDDGPSADHTRTTLARSLLVLVVGLAIWILPLVAVSLSPGIPRVIGQEALFFSQAAMVTFGGAYAVLAYVNQAAVHQFGWLLPGQMVTGLGLAESTPGPLIMVTEFVGFIGAYRNPGGLDPSVAGIIGAVVTTWATFAPCFLWIFLGAPYIERLRDNRRLTTALSAITAAVVGVVLNLAVTFAAATLFDEVRTADFLGGPVPVPSVASLDLFAFVVATASFVALWRLRVNILWVIGASALAGLLRVGIG